MCDPAHSLTMLKEHSKKNGCGNRTVFDKLEAVPKKRRGVIVHCLNLKYITMRER